MKDKVTNKWFYSNAHFLSRCGLAFVKGDMIVLLPVATLIALSYLLSIRLGVFLTGSYISVRYVGEMFYWIAQQFGPKTYRPDDWGLKHLDTNAIYIIYQTLAIAGVLVGLTLVYVSLLHL